MSNSEKFFLKWNDFKDNVGNAFGSLRTDNHFTDVTLACEDGQLVEAHKVVLASSSPTFQRLLEQNKHSHPLIYMRGMKSEDLVAIVDFLYLGETNVYQENLDSFLNIAEELNLKGLNQGEKNKIGDHDLQKSHSLKDKNRSYETKTTPTIPITNTVCFESSNKQISTESALAIPKLEFMGELHELDETIKTMMLSCENLIPNGKSKSWKCKVCGKEGSNTNTKDHIEANHIDGINVPCEPCQNNFKSRHSLRSHQDRYHK